MTLFNSEFIEVDTNGFLEGDNSDGVSDVGRQTRAYVSFSLYDQLSEFPINSIQFIFVCVFCKSLGILRWNGGREQVVSS